MEKRFQKGDHVFQLSTNFAAINEENRILEYMAIIERIVDACGKKQMTFEERGHDLIFGRSTWSGNPLYFATIEGALEKAEKLEGFQWTRNFAGTDKSLYRMLIGIYQDNDPNIFDEIEAVKSRNPKARH